ncbi:hypothetical protein FD15_GL002064 [Liquorilactobacillus sucicola DSM 21376 = JCM 15457]|uniref:Uncharacterized protein n=1 Tax=Liquorilactobacillus sucicola DSM 21376 = JCM 15457 TaxID=1423806 RepID=A0A0R2DZ43_9LACO|nr:hypothetical protein FD15_GL002064 [Liquorilactobacillus sucicola DSM 21376 = JCM 15457]
MDASKKVYYQLNINEVSKLNRNKIILVIIGILTLSTFYKLNFSNQEQDSINAKQKAQITKLKAENKKLTAQQVTFANSVASTTTTKTNPNKKAEQTAFQLFSSLNTWNADNWLEKQQTVVKYATDNVLANLGGQSNNNKSIAVNQLKQLNATSQLTSSNIYFEQEPADNEIKGIFIGIVKTTSSGNQTTNNVKYQFTYDTKQRKIIEISTF